MKSVKKVVALSLLMSSAVVFAEEPTESISAETVPAEASLFADEAVVAPTLPEAEQLLAGATRRKASGCSQEELDRALVDAAASGSLRTAEVLLALGANVDGSTEGTMPSPLQAASYCNENETINAATTDIMRLLLQKGATTVLLQDGKPVSLVHYVASTCQAEKVKVLYQAGADFTTLDDGRTVLEAFELFSKCSSEDDAQAIRTLLAAQQPHVATEANTEDKPKTTEETAGVS